MKVRQGFVSNSSSSSFVIKLEDLDTFQLIKILANQSKDEWGDATDWQVKVENNYLKGDTSMDNYSYREYLESIGVDMTKVKWDGENER